MHRVLVLGAGKIGALISGLLAGRLWSAIQITTAAGITAVVDQVLAKPGAYRGFVRQEQFRLPAVLANRFGAWFQNGGDKGVSGRMVVEGKAGRQRNLVRVK